MIDTPEIKLYSRLVTALQKTTDIQRDIGNLYNEVDPSE
jgi:hypothetical protein